MTADELRHHTAETTLRLILFSTGALLLSISYGIWISPTQLWLAEVTPWLFLAAGAGSIMLSFNPDHPHFAVGVGTLSVVACIARIIVTVLDAVWGDQHHADALLRCSVWGLVSLLELGLWSVGFIPMCTLTWRERQKLHE